MPESMQLFESEKQPLGKLDAASQPLFPARTYLPSNRQQAPRHGSGQAADNRQQFGTELHSFFTSALQRFDSGEAFQSLDAARADIYIGYFEGL
jgi:hypothetical protein